MRTRCLATARRTVGPGYVSRFVATDGTVLVDDLRRPGTLNDPEFGGLGAFGWHHARGTPGKLRFTGRNAWEISGRICAARNSGFGVSSSGLVEPPRGSATRSSSASSSASATASPSRAGCCS